MKFLFDLGGVFFDWDPRYFFVDIFKDTDELNYFLSNVCNDEWNIQQDAGRSILDAEDEIISKFPTYKNQIKMYYANHRKMIRGTFQDSIETLNMLTYKNYPCYVLSNWSAETFQGMSIDYPFLKNFDGMIISGEEKLVKPDPKIYKLAINRFNLDPSNCVFIDDKIENINAAKIIGFDSIHLKEPTKIKLEINKFLV